MLNKANLVGKKLCQGEIDYETGDIFHGSIVDPEIKYVFRINSYGII